MSDMFADGPWPAIRFPLLAAASAGSTVFGAAFLLPFGAQLALHGVLLSGLLGVVLTRHDHRPPSPIPADLENQFQLASDEAFFDRQRRATALFLKASRQADPIYRVVALEQVDRLLERLTSIAAGTIVYDGTEAWRLVYEQLLRSPGLFLYRSVACVRTADYWQDEPGRKSMQVNFELIEQGTLVVERVVLVADELWPVDEAWPREPIRGWLCEQAMRGVDLKVARLSALAGEPDLAADLGIYGSRALGLQDVDGQGRTVRFTLTFDFARVVDAESRWERLQVYAKSYTEHLDRSAPIR